MKAWRHFLIFDTTSAGIENIFNFLRIDYVWRLNYRNHPDIQKSGIRMTMALSFWSLTGCSFSPSNSSKASPSVGTARRTVRKLLRALGQSVEQFESFSERWDSPSNCSTASPHVGTARRTVRQLLRTLGRSVELFDGRACMYVSVWKFSRRFVSGRHDYPFASW